MEGIILLNSNENTAKVEEEEKSRFFRSILEILGVPISDIWIEDKELTVENKIKLNSLLQSYSIKTVDSRDGELDIYVEDNLIARWNKCRYILKRDLLELDPRKKLYIEMHTDFWSIFEDNTNNE